MHISILIALRWAADWQAPRRVLQVIEFQEKIISSQAAANVCKYVIPRLVQCVPKGYPQSYPQVTNRLWKAQSGQALGAAWSGKMTRVSANWKPTTGCALHPGHCRHKPEYLMRICTHATAASSARHLCCSATESSLDIFRKLLIFMDFIFCHLSRQNAGSHAEHGLGALLPRSSTKLSTGAVGEPRLPGKPADTGLSGPPASEASKYAGWRRGCAPGHVCSGLAAAWMNIQSGWTKKPV